MNDVSPERDSYQDKEASTSALPIVWWFPDLDNYNKVMSKMNKFDFIHGTSFCEYYTDLRYQMVIELLDRIKERTN